MKKKLVLGIILGVAVAMLTMMCSKNESTEPEPQTGYKRTAVIEFFTYHHCQNCPFAEAAIDSIFAMHGDSLVVIEYHIRFAGDTLSPCSTFVEDREALYGVLACPTTEFDGVEEVVGAEGDLVATYLNILGTRFSHRSSLRIGLFNAQFVDPASVSFNIQIMADADISGRLFMVLTEDSVVLDDSVYHFVARHGYPDDNGMDFNVSEGDTFGTNGSIGLSWQPSGNVRVALFVQNLSTGEIYQGGEVGIGKPSGVPYEYDVTVTPATSQAGTAGEACVFTFHVANSGTEDDSYNIHASEVSTVFGWGWMMCMGGMCKMPDHGHIYDTLAVSSQSADSFTVEIIPNDSTGTEQLNVHIVSAGDTTLTESINIDTHIP
jgi:hypothetical protein